MKRVLLLLSVLLLAACGGGGGASRPEEEAKLLLDFIPNGVHAGIYTALERAFDEAEGVELEVEQPGASTDALKLLAAGDTDFAILDIHDLGLAREKGADLVGVMALVQRPLAAILAQPGIASPKDLEGERVGVTGLPSDVAVLESIVRGDGGDPGKVDQVTIGFEAVKALLAEKVAGATAFWSVEGVALREQRPDIQEFRLDDFGAPAYPELVLVTPRRTLEENRPLVSATVRALQRGYVEAQADPEAAVAAMVAAEPDLDAAALAAQLDAVAPAFTAGARFPGQLREQPIRAWAAFDLKAGILSKPLDVDRAFDPTLAVPISRD
jgi:ABC-type nitrate/sulfonate/bicarbonate transport system substrate-binding protein